LTESDDWKVHAEAIKRLLEESETDEDKSVLPGSDGEPGPEHQGGPGS